MCPNPVEAGAMCREWIQRRGTIFASDMQSFGKLWLEFCAEMVASGKENLSPESQEPEST